MTSFCKASISTPSNKSDPRCDARITLNLSRATDLEEVAAAGAVPLMRCPILLMKDMMNDDWVWVVGLFGTTVDMNFVFLDISPLFFSNFVLDEKSKV